MDNFNFKKYLVENKLTYQEKMKVKAEKKSLKEDDFINPIIKNKLEASMLTLPSCLLCFIKLVKECLMLKM